jgi:hypothetical protein
MHRQLVHAQFHIVSPCGFLGIASELYLFGQIDNFLPERSATTSRPTSALAYQHIRPLQNLESAGDAAPRDD